MKTLLLWLAARLREKSTYAGIAVIVGLVLRQSVSDVDVQTVAEAGTGIAGLILLLLRENGSPKITVQPLPPPPPQLAILLIAGLALLATPACSTIGFLAKPMDLTTVRKLALSLDASYAVVLENANVYAQRPKCGGEVVLCADPAAVARIVALDMKAEPLLAAMNRVVNDPAADVSAAHAAVIAATEAVDALKAVVPVTQGGAK